MLPPAILYADHLHVLQQRADAALARGGLEHLVVPSGTLHYQAFDDRDYPYAVNPVAHWRGAGSNDQRPPGQYQ